MEKKLKILFLPFDIASKGAITIDALNRIPGIEAKGFFVNKNKKSTTTDSAEYFEIVSFKKQPIKWVKVYLFKIKRVYELLKWADVLHWIWDSGFAGDIDLKIAKKLGKKGVIEWSGSDIRYPDRAIQINPYAKVTYNDKYEFAHIETFENSERRQKKFFKIGFYPLVTAEMDLYVNRNIFSKTYRTLHRLNVNDFEMRLSSNTVPLIVHSPTSRVGKGTKYVLAAINQLKEKYNFEFRLIENMSREQAFESVKECDIFIDQLLTGTYGMASCEAMSMGKPVICYIMKSVFENGLPEACPVINANIDNLVQQIEMLIVNSELRIEVGKKSRAYAENYLDVNVQALKLVKMYRGILID